MKWKQTEFVHRCPLSTSWLPEFYYSNMYPPNLTTQWIDTDKPESAIYKNDQIEYSFNEYGFRSDPFYKKSAINVLVSGCSLTVGVGVEYELTWPRVLKRLLEEYYKTEVSLWNVATSGASADYVTRSIFKMVRAFEPNDITHIFAYFPPIDRLEVPDLNNPMKLRQATAGDTEFPKSFVNIEYLTHHRMRIMCMLGGASRFAEPKIEANANRLHFNKEEIQINGVARDGQHPDKEWHERVAEMFFFQWKDKY